MIIIIAIIIDHINTTLFVVSIITIIIIIIILRHDGVTRLGERYRHDVALHDLGSVAGDGDELSVMLCR